MQKTAHSSAVLETPFVPAFSPAATSSPALRLVSNQDAPALSTPTSLSLFDLERQARDWLCDCQYRQHSSRTTDARRQILDKLLWFLREHEYSSCGLSELRAFLVYLATAHDSESGRWNKAHMRRAVKPRTIHTYHGHLRTFFGWMVKEEVLASSPMERIAPPVFRSDQVQPFSNDEIEALLRAARRSRHPRRDEAIILLLLDTGLRASELCSLRLGDLDMDARRVEVLGKGNKKRVVYFGRRATKALGGYLREQAFDTRAPLFVGDRGARAGEALTRSGLLQLIERLGKAARVHTTRCSPHTFRHTFAVSFLRNGGNSFTLMQLLGHTSLDMTNRYVSLAQADLENQHRQFSPADRLGS